VSDFPKPSRLQEDTYDFRCWFLYYPKETLYRRIETRCDEMLALGLLREVQDLDALGIRCNPSASQAIGYRQALAFLQSSQTEEEYTHFVHQFKKATRHFAKRQLTWFRKEPLFRWLNLDETPLEQLKEWILQDFECL
jgi:tRNA dimethylallyltransferase